MTAVTVGPDTSAALDVLSGGNPAVAQLALMYAKAYEENPAAAFGMLAVTMTMIQQQVTEVYDTVGMVREKVQPLVDNPDLIREGILGALPPQFRAMFGG